MPRTTVRHLILATLVLASLPYAQAEQPCSIINSPSGGRLGDQLITYAKIKWLAYKHNLQVLCRPFPYSDQFMLDDLEQKYTPEKRWQFSSFVNLEPDAPTNDEALIVKKDGTLYSVTLYCKNKSPKDLIKYSDILILEPWDARDTQFLDELKKMMRPKVAPKTIDLPGNCISIAAHVRRGGDYEPAAFMQTVLASKFPPDQYYIDHIKLIADMFKGIPLYVYIYTDANDPVSLAKKYELAVNNKDVVFDCRKQDNHYDKNVLEDMFSMAKFDCLIRPDSNFSVVAQLLGNHAVVVLPKKYTPTVIEQVTVLVDEKLKQELLARFKTESTV